MTRPPAEGAVGVRLDVAEGRGRSVEVAEGRGVEVAVAAGRVAVAAVSMGVAAAIVAVTAADVEVVATSVVGVSVFVATPGVAGAGVVIHPALPTTSAMSASVSRRRPGSDRFICTSYI